MTEHLTELLSRYQELRVLLIDASQRLTPEQLDEVKELLGRLNPKCRLWTSTGPQGIQVQSASVNKRWMWSAQAGLNPAPRLYAAYARAQANGTPFLLNVGPKPDGTIPDNQLEVLKEVKAMIANPPAVAPASPAPAIKAPPSERLKQAKQLFEQGLIGKEDYDKKVKEIMDSI
jgi:alpha-L-fucosidase